MVLNFEEVPEFQKDVKRLKKSWRSIPSDIERVKLVIERLYVPAGNVDMKEFREQLFATRRATVLTSSESYEVIKMRLDCASLGNDKKTRLVFVAIKTAHTIYLIELYAKNAKEQNDSKRVKKYVP